MKTPEISSSAQKRALKITLLNAQKSAIGGLMLLLVPFLFLLGNIFQYELGVEVPVLSTFSAWLASFDEVPGISWLVRFLLLGGPLIAVLINVLAITHVVHDKKSNELILTLKLRLVNLALILSCGAVLAAFLLYLVVENS